jgi:hypothetical protein
MLKQLTLESLAELDGGKGAAAFMHHLTRAAADCADRPMDGKARVVTLKVELTPVAEEAGPDRGECHEVKLKVSATSTVPTHKTKVYSLGLRNADTLKPMLVFNEDAPDNVNQTTMLGE